MKLWPSRSFAQVFDSEELQAKRFMEGLQPRLKLKVMAYRCQTIVEMVEMASRFEDEYKQYMEGRPKGKSKTSFASRFSFSSMPSSSGTASAGKRRKDRAGGVFGARHSFAGGSDAGPSQTGSSGP